jgi:hypothetical protein
MEQKDWFIRGPNSRGSGSLEILSLKPEMVGRRIKAWTIMSTKIVRVGKEKRACIFCSCSRCGCIKPVRVEYIKAGRSSMCHKCATSIALQKQHNKK